MIAGWMGGVNVVLKKQEQKKMEEIAFGKTQRCFLSEHESWSVILDGWGGQGGQEKSVFSCSAHICDLNQHSNVRTAGMNTR